MISKKAKKTKSTSIINIANNSLSTYKTNAFKFNLIKNKTINHLFKFVTIIILAVIVGILVLFITDIGFDEINAYINRKLIWVILLSSINLVISTFIVQTLTHNKLADTSVLGIGSINLVLLTIAILFLDISNKNSINTFNTILPFLYIAGSIIASLLIFGLSSKNKFEISKKFILAGILLNFAFSAVSTSVSTVLSSSKSNILSNYSSGLIEFKFDFYIYMAIALTLFSLIWFYSILRKYRIVTTNNIIANRLGINIRSIYWQGIIISAIMTATAFFLVGNVVFLGLVGANIALYLFKKDYKYGVVSSGLIGFIILGLTYFFNKNLIVNSQINTSTVIPLIATPYFLYLILKKN